MTARNFRKSWAVKLKLPFEKPKPPVKGNNHGLGLPNVARFMHSLPLTSSNLVIVEKLSTSKFAFILGSTLHINPIHLSAKDELNFISLATHFRLVDEVRIHTFHIDIYLTNRKTHVRFQPVRWEVVKLILQFVNRGPWIKKDIKIERAIKITFDEHLKPAVEAWRNRLPYWKLVFGVPRHEIDLISTTHSLPWVHSHIRIFEDGYSSESEQEVDEAHERVSNNVDVNDCPFDPDFFLTLLS